jgi:hypothetical protein
VTVNGSAGSSGAYTEIVVDENTLQVLYYQCQNHAYMGSVASVLTDAIAATGTPIGAFGSGSLIPVVTVGADGRITNISNTSVIHASFTITNNGTSAYLFNGAGSSNTDNETLYLYKGFTYEFVNTTGASHPFQILNTAGGTAFANGVSGNQAGTQLFVVPHAQESNLVYQCSNHSGMQGILVIVS